MLKYRDEILVEMHHVLINEWVMGNKVYALEMSGIWLVGLTAFRNMNVVNFLPDFLFGWWSNLVNITLRTWFC